ncbi:MAG: M20 family metallopeptidase [Deltaproteobacteria bacterium]|nr:MAG: M20 family metallopeptidase [Deltaproteobacteria bacterium]
MRHGIRRAARLALALAFTLAGAPHARAELDATERSIRDALFARRDAMLETLAAWVDLNTGSRNRSGLQAFAGQLASRLERLGFEVALTDGALLELPGSEPFRTGPLVVAERAAGDPDAPRFLLQGHLDTVFEPVSPFQAFERAPDGRTATGPGVTDMKGGLVVLFFALELLRERGELDAAAWTVLLNSDEELGSLGSRRRIEEAARSATYGFVFEAAHQGSAMVRSRRGLGQFHLAVRGVAAHAGSAHEQGRSAIRELAEKVLRIEALTDYARGITLNVGTIEGGAKRNIVPERASAWVDLRYDDVASGEAMRRRIEAIAGETFVEGTETRVWGTLHRPPKPRSDATERLLALHAQAARDLGVESPEPLHAGGGTDGSLMQAVGLPTLDTMGVVGGHAHTDREFVELASLPERAALAAIYLRRLARAAPR